MDKITLILLIFAFVLIAFVVLVGRRIGNKIERTAQNIPTTKVSTGAVGSNVEIKGNILTEDNKTLESPFSKSSCSLYWAESKDYGKINFDVGWSHPWFYVEDGSGALALVFTKDANLMGIETANWPGTNAAAKENIIDWEWLIKPGGKIYVLGNAKSSLDRNLKHQTGDLKSYIHAKKKIQESSELSSEFDVDGDGVLNIHEMEAGIAQLISQIKTEGTDKPDLSKVKMVFRATRSNPLILSNYEIDAGTQFS